MRTEPRDVAAGAERCDTGCPARAITLFESQRRGQLTFCGHHATRLETDLFVAGFRMLADGRALLIEQEDRRRW